MTITSAPRRRSAAGLVSEDAPCPVSSATVRPSKSMPCSRMERTACSMYISHASSTSTATPSSGPLGMAASASPAALARATRPSRPPSLMNASISSSTASGSLKPSASKNLMPLYSGGLCEAEITAPPAALSSRTRSATAGVGMTPGRSAVPPALVMPATIAASSMSPDRRVSLPTRMDIPILSTAAWPSRKAISQVSSVFATPRTPSVPKSRAIAHSSHLEKGALTTGQSAFLRSLPERSSMQLRCHGSFLFPRSPNSQRGRPWRVRLAGKPDEAAFGP